MFMIEDPGWVKEMIDFWTDFISRMMAPVLEEVEVDYIVISEDVAYKAHSMIFLKMTCKFLLPVYNRWVKQIKESGCPIVAMDSDGHIGELIPIWIDAGINCCEPMEAATGNDIVDCRKTYGGKMAYRGFSKGGAV